MSDVGASLIKEIRRRLTQHFPDQVRACLDALADEELWWRPNESSNSVGNLVLHMCGSSRHFIGRGVGGSDYRRDRPGEFADRGPLPRPELLRVLEETVAETARVLDTLTPERLRETTDRVGEEQTIQYLISRTSHHWAVHTGQIVYVTKMKNPAALSELWEKTLKP
ncbi:MAG TPA: DUF1572 family protein [Vicinamibacteria bacterium]|nr:DUF1572 family protein [Vicinamibacteria bacterium]